jgi:hypothetical protein
MRITPKLQNLQVQKKLAGQVPAEEACRAAVAEMAATLESLNVEVPAQRSAR